MNVARTLPTKGAPVQRRNRAQRARRLLRASLATVEVAALLTAPAEHLLHRRCLTEQLPYVAGDRLAPIAVIVSEDVPPGDRWATFFRAVAAHRRHHAANDQGASNLVQLAARRVERRPS